MAGAGSDGGPDSVAGEAAATVGDVFAGTRLGGHYEVEAPLGDGGMGAVYRVRHVPSQKQYALKLLKTHARTATLERRFQREARALGQLEHRNVVAIVDDGVYPMPYLVMELVDGRSLAALLAEGMLPVAQVLSIAAQLLAALIYVHDRKVVHRDLKPANVLLERNADGSDTVKLVDFGFAKFMEPTTESMQEQLTRTGEIFGTPAYMAPEQIGGDSSDPRMDQYAVGVILFEMLAGRRPFEGSLSHVLRGHLAEPPPTLAETCPLRGSTPALEALLARALEKEPEDRFANIREMADALSKLDTAALEAAGGDLRSLSMAPTMEFQTESAGDDNTEETSQVDHTDERTGHTGRRLALAIGVLAVAAGGLYMTVGGVGRRPTDTATAPAAPSPAQAPTAAAAPPAALTGEIPAPAAPEPHPQPAPEVDTAPDSEAEAQAQPQTSQVAPSGSQVAPSAPSTQPGTAEAPPARPRATNPWARPIPKALKYIHAFTERGDQGSKQTTATLRRYNREHPRDARGHLLLARMYMNRGWRADALAQYRYAYTTDPASRGAKDMLDDLLSLVPHRSAGPEAAALVTEAYGIEALEAIDRAIDRAANRKGGPDESATAALSRLRQQLTTAP